MALAALFSEPELRDSQARDEIQPYLRSLHVARKGRRGRHFLLYRVRQSDVIEVPRILHDSMDLGRHLHGNVPPVT